MILFLLKPQLPLSVIGEELAYVFGAPLCDVGPFPRTFSAKERLLSEATMKYWSNFAKTGCVSNYFPNCFHLFYRSL